MAYKKHPREITDQQFSTGTTIDGSRIDDAMSDAVDRVNDVPRSDIATRWTQTQYVMGFSKPNQIGIGTQPFLPIKNDDSFIYGTAPETIQNPWRIKACDMIDVQPTEAAANCQYAWTVPLYFARPAIVDSIHVFLTKDNASDTGTPPALIEYNGGFVYGARFPPGKAAAANSEDLSIVMHVDSPFAPEERSQNDIEVVRHRFQINRENFTQIPWHNYQVSTNNGGTAWTDMLPAQYPGGGPAGSAVILDDLNVPIHANSRARLAMVIPPLSATFGSGGYTNTWNSTTSTWGAAYYTMVLTVLEEVV
jgi:hypothetical protein